MTQITVTQSDLVCQPTDAMVNAVNRAVSASVGLEGAILATAGPEAADALANARCLSVGTTQVTPGYALPARWLIHIVSPRWDTGVDLFVRQARLRETYQACLRTATEIGARSIALPSIGVGAHGWPLDLAADAAMEAMADWIDSGRSGPGRIVFVCASPAMTEIYRRAADDWELPLNVASRREEAFA